jgi:hypothetical protein
MRCVSEFNCGARCIEEGVASFYFHRDISEAGIPANGFLVRRFLCDSSWRTFLANLVFLPDLLSGQ